MPIQPCTAPTPQLPETAVLVIPSVLPIPVSNVPLAPPLATFAQLRSVTQLSVQDPVVLYALATLCHAQRATTSYQITQAAQAMFGSSVTVGFIADSSSVVPGYSLIVTPANDLIVVVGGTSNLNQWLAQTVEGSLVQTNFGPNSNGQALAVYYAAAQAIFQSIQALPRTPSNYLFVGHSMGGAVAAVAAYGQQIGGGRLPQRLVTFASPKPGDLNLSQGLTTNRHLTARISIVNDIVPALPPNLGILSQAFLATLPSVFQTAAIYWSRFFQINQDLQYISPAGVLTYGDDPAVVTSMIAVIISAAQTGSVATAVQHAIAYYTDYLRQSFGDFQAQIDQGWSNPALLDTVNASLNALGL